MKRKWSRALAAALIAVLAVSLSFGIAVPAARADSFAVTVTGGTVVSYTPAGEKDPVLVGAASQDGIPAGALVAVAAADTTAEHKVFAAWTVSAEGAALATLPMSNASLANAAFTMPSGNVMLAVRDAATLTLGIAGAATGEGGVQHIMYSGAPVGLDTAAFSIKKQADASLTSLTPADCDFCYTGRGGTTYTPADAATAPAHAGEYTLTVSIKQNETSVYAGSASLDFSITPAPITITGVTATDRAFIEGSDRIAIDTANATIDKTNVPSAEKASITLSVDADPEQVYGTVADGGAAGTGLEVTVHGVGCAFGEHALAGDYSVTVAKPTVNIGGYLLTDADIEWSGHTSLEYDGSAKAVTARPKEGLPASLAFAVTGGDEVHAGDHTAKIESFSDGETVSGNYMLPAGGLSLDYSIAPCPIAIVWDDDSAATRDYSGTAFNVTAAIQEGALLGTDACTLSISGGDAVNAGDHTATATLEGASKGDYTITNPTKDYSIRRKAIALGAATVADKVYDGTSAGTLTDIAFTDLCGSDALTLAQNDFAATVTLSQTGAGENLTATVSVTLGDTALAKNYTFMAGDPPVQTRTAETTATGRILAKPIAGTLAITFDTDANGNGRADPGDVLRASGVQPADADVLYQWKRAGSDISGATAATYLVTSADAGKLITCAASGRNNFGGAIANTTGISSSKLPLPGTVYITGSAALGQTLTATLVNGPAGGYTWKWYRGANEIQTNGLNTRVIGAEDLGQTLTAKAIAVTGDGAVYDGDVSGTISIPAAAPAAPVIDLASDTAKLSITWNKPDGRGSAILGYLLVVRRAGTEISGSPFSLPADQTSFTLTGLSGGATFTATLTAINAAGRTDSNTPGIMVRAPYSGSTPAAPTRYSRTTTSITLDAHNGYEYSRDGASWQDSNTFKGLKAGTSYTFYQRVKATTTHDHSATSPKYTTSTVSGSSSSSDDDDDDTGSTGGTTGGGTTAGTGTTTTDEKLYELSVTEANTNILYSTMNKLIRGNADQAVTISFPRVTYTFAKGTMTAVTGRVWYDLGVAIDNCVHNTTVQNIAGDAHVLTLHFNYNSTLPGQATIRIFLGTQYAGQTLYYFKLDEAANRLVFQQNTTVDAEGWASVQQSECSDYALLDRDITAAAETPTPSASPSSSPEPTATGIPIELTADPERNKFDWQLAAIIGGAALVLLGILWLCLKKRSSDADYDDDEDAF